MAKREQLVEETLGLIAQAQAEYGTIVEEVRSYCQKARELRQQAEELRRSGNTDPQVATEISKLLGQENGTAIGIPTSKVGRIGGEQNILWIHGDVREE